MKTSALFGLAALGLGSIVAAACGDQVEGHASATGSGAATSSSSHAASSSSSSAGAGGSGGQAPSIAWGPCEAGYESECATVTVPLDWSDPKGKTIDVYVSRKLGKQPGQRAVWMLSGGPGQAANIWTKTIDKLQSLDPSLDVYALEHRGTGHSARLSCPDQEKAGSPGGAQITQAEWPACIQHLEDTWGQGLASFNTTQAAKDLGALVDATRAPGQKTFIYGGSYGTYWAHRYLQIFPKQPAGIILDGIFTQTAQWLSSYDANYDVQAKKLADLCDKDALCSSKIGAGGLWAAIGTTYDELAQGHCGSVGLDKTSLQSVLAYLLDGWTSRSFVPPLVYRLHRCNAEDQNAIATLFSVLFKNQTQDTQFSMALQNNILFSELWAKPPPPTAADLQAIVDKAYFAPGLGPYDAPIEALWPKYQPDAHFGQWVQDDVPMLMMNGTMDTRTPIETAKVMGEHYTKPDQTFVTIPWAAHTAAAQSPVKTMGAPGCGFQMMAAFLADETKPIDTSCLNDLLVPSFTATQATALKYWGSADLWENVAPLQGDGSAAADVLADLPPLGRR